PGDLPVRALPPRFEVGFVGPLPLMELHRGVALLVAPPRLDGAEGGITSARRGGRVRAGGLGRDALRCGEAAQADTHADDDRTPRSHRSPPPSSSLPTLRRTPA